MKFGSQLKIIKLGNLHRAHGLVQFDQLYKDVLWLDKPALSPSAEPPFEYSYGVQIHDRLEALSLDRRLLTVSFSRLAELVRYRKLLHQEPLYRRNQQPIPAQNICLVKPAANTRHWRLS